MARQMALVRQTARGRDFGDRHTARKKLPGAVESD
jgi:hypothetical protein